VLVLCRVGERVTDILASVLAEPSQLLPARTQMAFTLGFHVILVPLGVAFTAMTLIANYRAIKKGDEVALLLAQRWSKVAAVLFAVGAVSGTVLSFEMGLLWPGLMDKFGAAYGLPFMIEGVFFFIEAIFIAIYIYGWKRMKPWPHFWTGVPVVLSGIGGTLSVVAANAWMNAPGGYTMKNGEITDVEPLKVIFNDAFWYESLHMLLAAYLVAGFLVASVYAWAMLKGRRDRYHRVGFLIPFTVAAIVLPFQMIVGDATARAVFKDQPIKFAAIELVPDTSTDVPETIGGLYIDGEIVGPKLEIPGLASLLSDYSTDTEITGFNSVPLADRPPVNIVHLAWDTMLGIATYLFLLAVWFGVVWWRKRDIPQTKWFLRAAAVAGVAAVVCMEAGWVITEVGRQPWIVYEVLRTEDAVTTADGIWASLSIVMVLYAVIGVTTIFVLRSMTKRWRGATEVERVPYGPSISMTDVLPGPEPKEPESAH
jgi:cytochrome d ubiquinol oxidase subunit I